MERGKIFSIVIVAILAVTFVFAASSVRTSDISNLQLRGNYSDTMNVSIYTSLNVTATEMNATIWYNATGGPANGTTGTSLVTINNGSDGNIIENATVRVADLSDTATYNFSIYVDNGTDQEWIVNIETVRIDNTAPNVSSYRNAFGNYSSNNVTFNVTVDDSGMGVETVILNITNSSGEQNYSATATGSGNSYTISVNVTTLPDGKYNVTAWANDTQLGNLNSSEEAEFVVDRTNPTATASCSNVETGSAFPCTCGGTDATAGVNSTTGTSSSPDGTATPSSTGTFTYTCTVTDHSGNSGTDTKTYSVTSPPGSSGGSGGSSSSSFYTKTIPKNGAEFSTQGTITQDLKVKERIKLLIDGDTHHIGVRAISSGKVTIEVTSNPQTFDLTAGQMRKIDADSNGVYDMVVELVSVTGTTARIKTYSISETVPEDQVDDEAADDEEEDSEEPESEDKGSTVWIWVLVAVVLVILVVLWTRRSH